MRVDEHPHFLTIKQFCACYAVSRSKCYELIACGHLEKRKSGRRTFIVGETAARWANSLPRK